MFKIFFLLHYENVLKIAHYSAKYFIFIFYSSTLFIIINDTKIYFIKLKYIFKQIIDKYFYSTLTLYLNNIIFIFINAIYK